MFIVRRKSPPVPNGISAKLASGAIGAPLLEETVDDLVDRAVAADRDDALGAGAQRLARELASHRPGASVIASSNGNARPIVSASSSQRLPSRPPCEFGLTMTIVRGASTIGSIRVVPVTLAQAREIYPGPSWSARSIFVFSST